MNQGADYRSQEQRRAFVSPVPTKWERLKWFGPGFVWMVSSVGSGSILFTPRVGSRYGYDLLWAALIVTFLTWVIIREIGRYTVVSGRTILEGYEGLKGPRGWAVWLIFVPGIVSGIVVVSGIAALVGSALVIVLPLNQAVASVGIILVSAVLVISGQYKKLELVTTVMAVIMIVSVFLTAIAVFPGWEAYGRGLIPTMVPDFDLYFILPWFGFLLAGAAGMMWFSYWVAARGYGGEIIEGDDTLPPETSTKRSDADTRLRRWLVIMSTTAAIGVLGATIVNFSFLTLGAELLRPLGVIPEGIRVAEDLARLLGEVWGGPGQYLLVAGIFVALWGSILSNQDGWGRMYADATLMLLPRTMKRLEKGRSRAGLRRQLMNSYILVVLTGIPIIVFLLLRNPVVILSVAGIITAAHLPIMVALTLYLNLSRLPRHLGPGIFFTTATGFAIVFYAFFSILFFYNLLFS
ncbi:Nramp family divalent metal transporter [Desulfonatronum lacustre]|uniref:Nramp family divalent metal transporter n=1 Tax=Desulfonatronum lacustre TaxID=66849 RepID=UPI00048B596E|nr:Nramp family divalent metal transporter [Desulfonatronum lacustre]